MFQFLADLGMNIGKRLLSKGVDQVADKVTGVPTPPDPLQMGIGSSGVDYREFMDNAFPGTTPWERLGANTPYGSIGSADLAAKNQLKLQYKDLEVRERLANQANLASVIASASPGGAIAVDAAVSKLLNPYVPMQGYDNKVQQDRESLQKKLDQIDASINQIKAQTGTEEARAQLEKERAKYASLLAKLDVAKGVSGAAGSAVGGLLGGFVGGTGLFGVAKSGIKIYRNLRNNSRMPARYMQETTYGTKPSYGSQGIQKYSRVSKPKIGRNSDIPKI